MAANAGRGAVQFGQTLARLRTEQRLSQNQLAQRAGVNHSYISRLESGGRGDPSLEMVGQCIVGLGLDPNGAEADELRMSAGYLPADPAHLLAGNAELANLARLLDNPHLPEPSRVTLRRFLAALVEEYSRIAGGERAE